MKPSLASALCALAIGSAILAPVRGDDLGGATRVSDAAGKGSGFVPPPPAGPASGGYPAPVVYGGGDGRVVMQDPRWSGIPVPFGPMLRIDGRPGDGLGYESSYIRFDAFLPQHVVPGRSLFFTSLAGSVGMNGDLAGNFGGGFRTIGWGNRLYGISGWFDLDDRQLDTYYRAGVSLETLGRYFDVRLNGYFLLDTGRNERIGEVICLPFFAGENIFFVQKRTIETPYGGGELEMGGLLPVLGKYGMYGYLGGYYLAASGADDTAGVSVRFHAEVNDVVTVGMRHTNDDVFGGTTWGSIALTLPGKPNQWFKPRRVQERLGSPVARLDRIAVHTVQDLLPVLATTPLRPGEGPGDADGAFVVIHVDPNRGPGGTGTFENPFGSLEEARLANNDRVDIILVRPRNDDTGINLDVTDPFGLFDNQRLLSTTRSHLLVSTLFDDCPLPEIGPIGGLGPLISNNSLLPESVVLLANNNEVSGFRIDGRPDVGTGDPMMDPVHDGIRGQGAITDFVIVGNTFQNVVNGVVLTASGQGLFAENFIDGSTFTDRGFSVTTTAGQTLDVLITENLSQNVNGLNEDLNGNGVLDPGEDINGNGVLDLGTAFEVVANAGTANVDFRLNASLGDSLGLQLSTANGGVLNAQVGAATLVNGQTVFESNVFSNSVQTGMRLAGVTGTINADILGNLFDRPTSTGAGLLINTTNVTSTVNLLANDFLGGPLSSFGVGGRVDGGSLLLSVGNGTTANRNVFDGNGDAGIGLIFDFGAIAELQINNNIFRNSVNGPDPNFDGDGMRFIALNAAEIVTASRVSNNLVQSNAGRGISFAARDAALIGGVEVTQNTVTGNGLAGIEFVRDGNAFIGGPFDRVLITNNLIDGNLVGLRLAAINQNTTDFYQVDDNQISNNTLSGVALRVEADADMDVNMARNIISSNGLHGIEMTEQVNAITDTRSITGLWVSNIIVLNGGHGILSAAATAALRVGLNGVDGTGRTLGNLISQNSLDGVSIPGPGSAIYTNNEITFNGDPAVGSVAAGVNGHGVDIEGVGTKNLAFLDNLISQNFNDGIEFRNLNRPLAFFLIAAGNDITFNGSRGVDILNQGNVFSDIVLNNNNISFNGEEGVYVVNTSSLAQDQVGLAPMTNPLVDPTHGLDASGATNVRPVLFLDMDGNFITGNGQQSTFDGTGLVIRVGTSDGGTSVADSGGYFDNGFRGGVGANITNNFFSGNFGDDVVFESFTSTVNPITTAGTWSATEFNVTAFRGDPLARFDLVFRNNVGDSLDVVRTGAWYDNAEPVFKSRLNDQDPAGPFAQADRRRNAQRLALRGTHFPFGDFTAPVVSPDGGVFQYPGVGESTFRLLDGLGTNFFPGGDDFTFFAPIRIGALFGELPYEWDPPTDTPTVPAQ